ncbi:nuclear transport factor 2 family protein [Novosphingobium sp. PASSN1]|uniref:nuclear transport factor 2 family protein n=1 Tax=Novosphingobium sp. PASSN1 TaxID=2015561 RepID=UPI0025CCC123|nr:nuclear transport factor 2 family protein [Novosphingobium sp. PASSN1]
MSAPMENEGATLTGGLAAKQAISEQIYRYCRGLDRMDLELALSVWHDDGTVDFGAVASPDTGLATAAIPVRDHFARAWPYREQFFAHSHQATNILIDLHGDTAVSETASISILQRKLENGDIAQDLYWGRWLDRWSFRSGRWALDHRQAVLDCHMPAQFAPGPLNNPQTSLSRRDRTDPSYTMSAFA